MSLPAIRRMSNTDAFLYQRRYSKHRKLLQHVSSRINTTPAPVMARTYLKMQQITQDQCGMKRILRSNIQMIKKINRIHLNTGLTESYNRFKPVYTSRVVSARKNLANLEVANLNLACKILRVKSLTDTKLVIPEERTVVINKKFAVPKATLAKYEDIFTKDHALLTKLLRPKIYFDMEIKDTRPLGRMGIQLFTEACPGLVLQFMKSCALNQMDYFHFIRVFPLLWIEGELEVESEVLTTPNFEHKWHVLQHNIGPGVFSFAKSHLEGFPPGILNFTISFKPVSVLQGQRLVFGLVTSGLKVLECLRDYGTKNGKTTKTIIVAKCGIV